MSDRDAGWEVVRSARRAAEVAVVGDATAAVTDLWRTLNGVDLTTASLEQMLDLDRVQRAAADECRERLQAIFSVGAAPLWVWESIAGVERTGGEPGD